MTIHMSTSSFLLKILGGRKSNERIRLIKFSAELLPLISGGAKTITYRLDEKFSNTQVGEELLYADDRGQVMGSIIVTARSTVYFCDLPIDAAGHEPYASKNDQFHTFKSYYGRAPRPDELVDVLHFRLKLENGKVANSKVLVTSSGSFGLIHNLRSQFISVIIRFILRRHSDSKFG